MKNTSAWNRRQVVGLVAILLGLSVWVAPLLAESDTEMEACLAEGKILKGGQELIGLTMPIKVEVECGGRRQTAVFKSMDVHRRGRTELADGSYVFNFADCYKFDRAAYLLDRELGLDMVPVTVLRRRRGKDGVLVAWIPNTVHENRVSSSLLGTDLVAITRQKSIMRLFDSLIYNIDRRPPNILIDESKAKLYMIDHTQAFREKIGLQEEFEQNRIWLSEDIYSRLLALDKERLDAMLADLVTRGQRKTLLARRDLIIEKIDRDRQQYGDEAVFVDPDRE